jgi:hypothetical protein
MVCVACALISEGISDNNTVAAPKNILFIVPFISNIISKSTAKVRSSACSTKYLGYSAGFCDE